MSTRNTVLKKSTPDCRSLTLEDLEKYIRNLLETSTLAFGNRDNSVGMVTRLGASPSDEQ
jgi:hypothetical protein